MTHFRIAVIGSGFSGLGTAIALKDSGRHDFVILERGDDIGGTWRDNTYPGCACDVPSRVYSFSFAQNPDWSHSYARQPEIWAYLQRIARDYDLLPHVRFGAAVTDLRYDKERQLWEIDSAAGSFTADIVVAGTGGLSEPSLPDIQGISTFAGSAFHSAQWDHSWSPVGKRIAVIGTGSSAIQFLPKVAPEAERLVLFQRTAPWVLPRRDRPIGTAEKRLYARVPLAQKVMRGLIYSWKEFSLVGFRYNRKLLKLAEKQALAMLEQQVPDPALRAKLTPHFDLGCKRVLLSNSYYPALAADNADVVTDRIVAIVPEGVVTEDATGSHTTHAVDTILFGTGFKIQDQPIAHRISVDGVSLAEHWKRDGMQAHKGLTIAGYPNLFMLVGPNTGLGHNSIILMIEAQLRHLMKALDHLDRYGLRTIEPRQDVQDAYNTRLQRELAHTVWNDGGCQSWYRDAHGRNTTLWPTFTFTYARELKTFDPLEYVLT